MTITLPNLSLAAIDRLLRVWIDERDALLKIGRTQDARDLTLSIAYLDDVRIELVRRAHAA